MLSRTKFRDTDVIFGTQQCEIWYTGAVILMQIVQIRFVPCEKVYKGVDAFLVQSLLICILTSLLTK